MDVIKNAENTILSLKSQVGTLSNGKPRYKAYSYSNVSTTAADTAMYAVAKSLASLFQVGIDKITRQDISILLEE